MIEKSYKYTIGDAKKIEKLINTKFCAINHMILNNGEGLPVHKANSDLHMIVIRGTISLNLDEQEIQKYEKGNILEIPYGTMMHVHNTDDAIAEIFVVKAPSPEYYKELVGG
ncbi:MAG: cupin domain-containing protein [Clostridiales bacterium]|nr:cupin domain-containing protein [Clostridiales bacterium]